MRWKYSASLSDAIPVSATCRSNEPVTHMSVDFSDIFGPRQNKIAHFDRAVLNNYKL
jgi:hypothetical protein